MKSPAGRALLAATALALAATACTPAPPKPGAVDEVESTRAYFGLVYQPRVESPMATDSQPDGRIVAAGRTPGPGGEFVVTRVDGDGSPDGSFGTSGRAVVPAPDDAEIVELLVDSRGRILLLALVRPSDSGPGPFIARLLGNGTPDTSFGDSGIVAPEESGYMPSSLVEVPGNRYAVTGTVFTGPDTAPTALGGDLGASDGPEVPPVAAVAMLADDGNLDESFGDGGIRGLVPDGFATAAALGTDGRLLVGGSTGVVEEGDLPSGGFLYSLPVNGNGALAGGATPLVLTTQVVADAGGRVVAAGLQAGYRGTVVGYPKSLPTSGGVVVEDPTYGSRGRTLIEPGRFEASLVRSLQPDGSGGLLGTAWRADIDGPDPVEELFRLDTNGRLDELPGNVKLVASGLKNPGIDMVLHSGTTVSADGALWVPGTSRDGTPGSWLGRFVLGVQPPPATCPEGPVRVTASNAAGAMIARWVCGMELVGTIWRGEGVLVLLPGGSFSCPSIPGTYFFDERAEFGFYLLQAKCGYEARVIRIWFGPWLAWVPRQ